MGKSEIRNWSIYVGKSIIYTIRRILRSCDYDHFKECESGSSRSQGHREITWPDLIAPQFCIFYSWETRRLRPHLIMSPWKPSPANKTKADLRQQREPVLKYFTCMYHQRCVLCCAVLSCVRLFRPHGLEPARLLCPGGFPRQEYWGGLPCPAPGVLPNPGIKPKSPALQANSFPSEPPGKHKNTGVGSLGLQGNLPTQESNWGHLHCRWILYQLSYQGSLCAA